MSNTDESSNRPSNGGVSDEQNSVTGAVHDDADNDSRTKQPLTPGSPVAGEPPDGNSGEPNVLIDDGAVIDDGPGWLPAIMAATVLMGILGFLFCAFSTWLLFQRRTELATRTIRDAYLPEIEQSYLDPLTKKEVAGEISQLATDLENGKYENWQSAGILQRLQRVPVLQWGRLTAVSEFYRQHEGVKSEQIALVDRGLSRMKRAIELDRLTSFDLQDILEPALIADPKSPSAFSLIQPLTIKASEKVFDRMRLWLEDSKIPDEDFEGVAIVDVVRKAIRTGAEKGTM